MEKRTRSKIRPLLLIPVFIATGIIAFFLTRIIISSDIFKKPILITYDESLTLAEKDAIALALPEKYSLKSDITLKAKYSTEKIIDDNYALTGVFVPVTDYYSPLISISSDIFSEKTSALEISDFTEKMPEKTDLIALSDLDYTKKLLKIDNFYYLDDFNRGAIYRYIYADGENISTEDREIISNALSPLEKTPFTAENTLSFTQTGVTALGRRLNTKMSAVGDGTYFVGEDLRNYLVSRDLVHTSSESSFYNYAGGGDICSDPRFITTLTTIGLDIVELTGNHNLDCGIDSALSTLDIYAQNNIKKVGGGRDLDDASIPLEISQKNTDITMLAFNYSTGGYTTGAYPGANPYNEEQLSAQIQTAKSQNHFVIIDIQFNECNAYANDTYDTTCDSADSSAPRDGYTQSAFFKHMIDLGADMVVGTSAHQAQTFELYNGHPIFYGLGNIFFDQTFWPDTARSLMLTHYFMEGKLLQTKISGTIMADDYIAHLLDDATVSEWITRLGQSR